MTTVLGIRIGAVSFYRPMFRSNPGFFVSMLMIPILLFVWTVQLVGYLALFLFAGMALLVKTLTKTASQPGRHRVRY